MEFAWLSTSQYGLLSAYNQYIRQYRSYLMCLTRNSMPISVGINLKQQLSIYIMLFMHLSYLVRTSSWACFKSFSQLAFNFYK